MVNDRLKHAIEWVKRNRKRPRLGWVYVLKSGEFYKIGFTDNLKDRLQALQCASPYKIELVKAWQCADYRKQERIIHGLLWRFHERNEWFKLPVDTVVLIGACAGSPVQALQKFFR